MRPVNGAQHGLAYRPGSIGSRRRAPGEPPGHAGRVSQPTNRETILGNAVLKEAPMIVGVPTEIKNNENRVALTPAGAHALVSKGHRCLVQQGAGLGSGITDAEYASAGGELAATADQVYRTADLIVKVKEPPAFRIRKIPKGTNSLHLPASGCQPGTDTGHAGGGDYGHCL